MKNPDSVAIANDNFNLIITLEITFKIFCNFHLF